MLGIGGRGTLMLINMLVLLVTSRVLTPAQFGNFAIAQLTVDFAAAASYSLVGIPLLQGKGLRAADYWRAFTLLLTIGIVAGCLLGMTAGTIEQTSGMPGLGALLRATALIVPARCTASFFIAALQRHLKVERIIWAQTKSQVTSALAVTLVAVVLGFGVWSLLLGLAASTFLELGWCVYAFRMRPRLVFGGWNRLFQGGFAAFLTRMLGFASDAIDRLAIAGGFGASPLGIYTRASNLVLIPTNLICLPAQNALLSWFSRIKARPEQLSNALTTAVVFQGVLLPPMTAAFCVASPLLVPIALGPKWSAAVPLAQVLFVATFARIGAVIALEPAALVTAHAWGSARRQLVSFMALVMSLWIAIHVSFLAVGIAVVIARLVYYVLGLRFVVIAFGVPRGSIIGAHFKGLLLSCLGLSAAFASTLLVHPAAWYVRDSIALLCYLCASGLPIVFGPLWLVGPVGPAVRTVIQRQLHLARNYIPLG